MKDIWRQVKKRKFRLKSKVLLGVISLAAVVISLGSTVQNSVSKIPNSAEFNTQESSLNEMNLLDPFTLSPVVLATESSSSDDVSVLSGAKTVAPIRIPYRPTLRSPIRPPLTH